MSRIKGWKKPGIANIWENIQFPPENVMTRIDARGKSVLIEKGKAWSGKGFSFTSRVVLRRNFPTNEKAYQFAINWMRKHPKG